MGDYLKLSEVARRLDVSEKTARRYVKSGALASTFIGGMYRVDPADLEAFVNRSKIQPAEETSNPKALAPEPALPK